MLDILLLPIDYIRYGITLNWYFAVTLSLQVLETAIISFNWDNTKFWDKKDKLSEKLEVYFGFVFASFLWPVAGVIIYYLSILFLLPTILLLLLRFKKIKSHFNENKMDEALK